ncbi:MAG: hypothetical protein ABIH87_00445 [bacterium]
MYLKWKTKTITDFSDKNIESLYEQCYVFGRTGKGEMYQTRGLRIDLSEFELNSENRRILKKTQDVKMRTCPVPYNNYHWSIHKLGKDFYTTKFGHKTFSANKIKELMTDALKSNFNIIFAYNDLGYCISLQTIQLVHYCYPFYDLKKSDKNMGLGMMLQAILYAKNNHKKYIYLGSASRPTDTYKLQFKGLEWFDGKDWKNNLDELKKILKQND